MMGADHTPTQVRPLQARQHRQSLLPQTTSVECAASQWRQLAEEAEETDKKPLPRDNGSWGPNGAGASGIHSSTDATNAGRANSGLDDFL